MRLPDGGTTAHAADAGIMTVTLIFLCLLALLFELQGQAVSAKMVAALGVMVALAAALRFLETGIPGPGGFSPIFVPILLAGYVFGARFGYLMGVMTLLVSALFTGGVGPWLPYQMFVSGWLGALAGVLPHPIRPERELALLILLGVFSGLIYGVVINLYFWPFLVGPAAQSWSPGSGVREAALRFGAFYLATSFLWDLFRVGGNVLLMLVLGLPAVRALTRFRVRLQFEVGSGADSQRIGGDVPV
jgi:energy-coupling factor transport system substrate-specific component